MYRSYYSLVKCKLRVTQNSNDSTGSSILKSQVESFESSCLSFESRCLSFKSSHSRFESRRQQIYYSINFSKYIYMSSLLVYFWRQRNFRVSTLEEVSACTWKSPACYVCFDAWYEHISYDSELPLIHSLVISE